MFPDQFAQKLFNPTSDTIRWGNSPQAEKEKNKYLALSIAIGVGTLGLAHLAYGSIKLGKSIKKMIQNDTRIKTSIQKGNCAISPKIVKEVDLGALNPIISNLKARIEIEWKPGIDNNAKVEDLHIFENFLKDLGHISNSGIYVGKDGKTLIDTSNRDDMIRINIEHNRDKDNFFSYVDKLGNKCMPINFSNVTPNDTVQVENTSEKSVCTIDRSDAKISLTYYTS